jgi:hypothetical protein
MSKSIDEGQLLGTPGFWDDRYKAASNTEQRDLQSPTHEWFRNFSALQPFFSKYLYSRSAEENPRILHLGCGDSVSSSYLVFLMLFFLKSQAIFCGITFSILLILARAKTVPHDLALKGYTNQICVDFSSTVIDLMKLRYQEQKGIEWVHGDVRDMDNVPSSSVDVAFDKGTLDAMIFGSPWSPPKEVTENSSKYMKEVCSGDLLPSKWDKVSQALAFRKGANQHSTLPRVCYLVYLILLFTAPWNTLSDDYKTL